MKTTTLIELGLKLSQSNDTKELQSSIEEAVDFMGATTYSAMACNTEAGSIPTLLLHNMPRNYLATFTGQEDRRIGRADPVMTHCSQSSLPIIWDASTYANAGQLDNWEHMASHGLCRGAGLGLHLDRHRHFSFGIEWDQSASLSIDAKAELAAALQILIVFAEPAAYRIQQEAQPPCWAPSRPLSQRESECLHWVSRGMTDDLIARIVGISPRTVRKHVESCILKLGTVNRTEAAVTATRLGLML